MTKTGTRQENAQTQKLVQLPDWAFRALGSHAIDILIDRCEHEVLISTRQGQPDIVMLSNAEWTRLCDKADEATLLRQRVATQMISANDSPQEPR